MQAQSGGSNVEININVNVSPPAPSQGRNRGNKSFNKGGRPGTPPIVITTVVEVITTVNIEIVINNQIVNVFNVPYTVVLDLSGVLAVVSNPHRLAMIDADGNFVALNFDEETGLFTFNTTKSGEFTVVYIENLRVLTLLVGSTIVLDLAQPQLNIPNAGTAPIIIGNVVLLPAFVIESLGFEIEWDGSSPTFTITIGNQVITITIGEPGEEPEVDVEDDAADDDEDYDDEDYDDEDLDDEDYDDEDYDDEDLDDEDYDDEDYDDEDLDDEDYDDEDLDDEDYDDADYDDEDLDDEDDDDEADDDEADDDDEISTGIYIQIINGHIMVSLQFLVEFLGVSTFFDISTGTIAIISIG